jgi:small-conductance mechanosensitive channel
MTPSSRARLAFGCIGVFPLIVVALHFVQGGHYHPLSDAVSVLALGRAGWLMAIAFCSLGTGTLLLATSLDVASRPRVGPWLIGLSGLLSFGSAFVHADGSGPSTTHGQVHQALGITTFILLIGGMFSLVRPFRRDPAWRSFATPTLAWAFTAVAAFFLIPISGSAYFGFAQRIFLGVILSWALATSLRAGRMTLRSSVDSPAGSRRASGRRRRDSKDSRRRDHGFGIAARRRTAE